MIEVNCETDFVARDDSFVELLPRHLNPFQKTQKNSPRLMDGQSSQQREIVQKLGKI